jgi:hypothetical protein
MLQFYFLATHFACGKLAEPNRKRKRFPSFRGFEFRNLHFCAAIADSAKEFWVSRSAVKVAEHSSLFNPSNSLA